MQVRDNSVRIAPEKDLGCLGVATETVARGREKDTIYPPRTDLAKPSVQGKTPTPYTPASIIQDESSR